MLYLQPVKATVMTNAAHIVQHATLSSNDLSESINPLTILFCIVNTFLYCGLVTALY